MFTSPATQSPRGTSLCSSDSVTIVMANHGRCPYKIRIRSSTDYVAISRPEERPVLYPAFSMKLEIEIPAADRLGIWSSSESERSVRNGETYFSHAGQILELDCSRNSLEYLKIFDGHNGRLGLQKLNCSSNKLIELWTRTEPDKRPKNLRDLDCSNNQMRKLDLDGMPAIENLNCSQNLLRKINLAGLKKLKFLDCSSNYLGQLNLNQTLEKHFLSALDARNNPHPYCSFEQTMSSE